MQQKANLMEHLIVGSVYTACLVVVIGIISGFGAVACHARWGDRADYNIIGGCFVSTSQGLVPEDRVRITE